MTKTDYIGVKAETMLIAVDKDGDLGFAKIPKGRFHKSELEEYKKYNNLMFNSRQWAILQISHGGSQRDPTVNIEVVATSEPVEIEKNAIY